MTRKKSLWAFAITGALTGISLTLFAPIISFHAVNIAMLLMSVAVVIAYARAIYTVFHTKGGVLWPPGYILALGIVIQWGGLLLRQVSFYLPPIHPWHYFLNNREYDDTFLQVANFPVWMVGVWLMLLGGALVLRAIWREVADTLGVEGKKGDTGSRGPRGRRGRRGKPGE